MEKIDTLREVSKSVAQTFWGLWANFVDRLPYIVIAILVVLLFWGISSIASRSIDRVLRHSKLRTSLRELLVRLVSIGLWVTGLLIAALIVFPGLTPAKALGGLGVMSLAVGLAFKDIFENFFAGMLILWRFPFENGDFIECEGVVGRVEDVTARMTKVRMVSGELVVLPNAVLFKNAVKILTAQPARRMRVVIGVGYGESVANAVQLITKTVKSCSSIEQQHPVEVFPDEFADSSINIEVCWWAGSTPLAQRKSRGEVLTAIKEALDDANIEIPFPYRTLTFNGAVPIESIRHDDRSE